VNGAASPGPRIFLREKAMDRRPFGSTGRSLRTRFKGA
jgi:hypothetical protein